MIGQQLYRLTPRDLQLTQLEILNFRNGVQANAAAVSAAFTVPDDRILCAHHVTAKGLRGGAVTLSTGELTVSRGGTSTTLVSTATGATVGTLGVVLQPLNATVRVDVFWNGEIYFAPGTVLTSIFQFSGADPANFSQVEIIGILLPRGNAAV